MRVENSIPNFREREFPGKFHSQISGTGMRVENFIPYFCERELEAGIPRNNQERDFRSPYVICEQLVPICVFGCQTPGNIVFEVLVPRTFQKYISHVWSLMPVYSGQ